MEGIVKEHMDEGWVLSSFATIPYGDGEVRVFYVFVKEFVAANKEK
jgi:hypothetical protein